MSAEAHFTTLPVFPLRTVLFPGMPLSLHIFEERYKAMLADLPAAGNRFVVALIRSGAEVGGEAEPFEVGCIAHITHVQRLEGDTFYVRAIGRERVRIVSFDRLTKPYLLGSVAVWPDEPENPAPQLVSVVRSRFEEYARVLAGLAGDRDPGFTPPSDPAALSALVATVVQMPPEERQQLLEKRGSAARLEAEANMLRVELPLLQALLRAPRPPDPGTDKFSAN